MLLVVQIVVVGDEPEVSTPAGRELRLHNLPHEGFVLHLVFDEVGDRAYPQPMPIGEGLKIGEPGHGAVFFHDLTDHAGRLESGKTRKVHRGLRMADPHEHTAIARHEGKYVAGPRKIVRTRVVVYRGKNGLCPVIGGYPRCHALFRLYRDGEGRVVRGGIVPDHQGQIETPCPFLREGKADQAAGIPGHEVDRLGRHLFCRDHHIALVLPVLIIHHDGHLPVSNVFDYFFNTCYCHCYLPLIYPCS